MNNDYCVHGKYVGGIGIDWICGLCEDGRTVRRTGTRWAVHIEAVRVATVYDFGEALDQAAWYDREFPGIVVSATEEEYTWWDEPDQAANEDEPKIWEQWDGYHNGDWSLTE